MFPLHDRVKRRIGMAGFVALCLVPTLGVLAWGVARRLPCHVRGEGARLGRQLGMDVSLDAVEHPLPGVVRYRELALTSPESGRTVLRCARLEAQVKTLADEEGKPRATLLLRAWQPQVETGEAAEVGQLLRRVIGLRVGNAKLDVQFAAERIELKADSLVQEFTDVQAALETTASGTQAMLRFRPAGNELGEPVRVRLGRNRQTQPAGDWFDLNTGDAAVACEVLALGIKPMGSLGPAARFRGTLWAARTPDGWQGEIESAQITGVDLDRVVSDRFSYPLSGTAQVTIDGAVFHRGRVEEVRGSVSAGPGQVGRTLVAAAIQRLGFEPGPTPTPLDTVLPYQRLALSFSLGASGLIVDGRCAGAAAGAVLCDGRGPLLGPPQHPQSLVALVRTLAPTAAPEVPVSPQTDWLSRCLPLGE